METVLKNIQRIGNFTSSEIERLVDSKRKKDKLCTTAITYIEEKNMERRLGRSLSDEGNARPLWWGRLGEKRVFELLPIDYSLNGDKTIVHPQYDCWSGTPDATKENTVCEVKCPMTLKSFCQLVDPHIKDGIEIHPALTIEAARANHKEGDTYYWQIVSNAILTGSRFGELIVYVPYQSELSELKGLAINGDGEELVKYYWIINAQDEELPHLQDGGYYKNLNTIRFEIPEADKEYLTVCVAMAKTKLIPVSPIETDKV